MKNKSEIENIGNIPSPAWVLEEKLLENNLNIFKWSNHICLTKLERFGHEQLSKIAKNTKRK